MTPFGTVLQTMTLECTPPLEWSYIHPIALVYMLSEVSSEFSALMHRIIDKLNSNDPTLNIILYIDECRPGNVLRPDKGRAVQHILWSFVEFPEWLTVRDQGWFTFGCIRSKCIETLPSHISCLMKHIVHTFLNFGTTGGMVATSSSDPRIFKANIAGFLGDEKGLKEVFGSKGPGGTKPCLSCKNVCQFLDDVVDGTGYLVSFKSTDRARFDSCSDAEVYHIVDELKRIAATGARAELAVAEQLHGLNFEPGGILFDPSLRAVVKPTTGWFRDWMHVMAVSGCANMEIEQVVHALRHVGVTPEFITGYFSEFVLPKAHGKVNDDWFTDRRIGKPSKEKDGWKGFSAEVLTIIPIFMHFLDTVIKPMGILSRNIECFRLLDRLMKLLALGPDTSVLHLAKIELVIGQHAILFKELYPGVIKPKFHHLFHIPDHIKNLKKLCSCFVTERRHRMVKAPASHIYNNFEKTLTISQLSLLADRICQANVFSPVYLDNPQDLPDDYAIALRASLPGLNGPVQMSTVAHLVCGMVHKGDLVMTTDNVVGEVQHFFGCSLDGCFSAWVLLNTRDPIGDLRHSSTNSVAMVVDSSDVIAPLIYGKDGHCVRVLPPNVSATR